MDEVERLRRKALIQAARAEAQGPRVHVPDLHAARHGRESTYARLESNQSRSTARAKPPFPIG
jgi:hypothetical protein